MQTAPAGLPVLASARRFSNFALASLPHSPLLVVLGPTGAGKSDLALDLAAIFSGEIVNADSIQVYRHLNVGSAKTPVESRRGIPHHLIDAIDVDGEMTAGHYSKLAREAVRSIHLRGRIPVIVGGTGFYLRALLEGLSPAAPANAQLRQRLAELLTRRPAGLHRFLRRFDPLAASRIHLHDHRKLIRAVELIFLESQPATITQSRPRQPIPGVSAVLKLGLAPERALLYEHLNHRCGWMFANGLLEEVQYLLDSGFSPALKPLQSLGYKQAAQVLTQAQPLDAAIAECRLRTRQYAKRQVTWFRREPNVHWLSGFGSDPAVHQRAIQIAKSFLKPP